MAIVIDTNRYDEFKIKYYVIARRLLFFGAILMVVTLPFLHNQIPLTEELSILFALFISLAAGLSHIYTKWITLLDSIIAAASFIFFSYYSVQLYLQHTLDFFFWVNNVLGITFFFVTYFSIASYIELLSKKNESSMSQT